MDTLVTVLQYTGMAAVIVLLTSTLLLWINVTVNLPRLFRWAEYFMIEKGQSATSRYVFSNGLTDKVYVSIYSLPIILFALLNLLCRGRFAAFIRASISFDRTRYSLAQSLAHALIKGFRVQSEEYWHALPHDERHGNMEQYRMSVIEVVEPELREAGFDVQGE